MSHVGIIYELVIYRYNNNKNIILGSRSVGTEKVEKNIQYMYIPYYT